MTKEELILLVGEIWELHESKQQDYGPEFQYFPFGAKSYIQMLNLKVARLINLVRLGKEPNYESIEDTVKDLIVYALMYMQYLRAVQFHKHLTKEIDDEPV